MVTETTPADDFRAEIQGKFTTILADPPWRFTNRTGKIAPEHKRLSRYVTLTMKEINALPVKDVLTEKAHLYLWVPNALIQEGLQVLKSWGFTYKTCLIWDKEIWGMGYWFRGRHELLLVATKGEFSPPAPKARIASVYREKRTKHSKKPEYFYKIIENYCPNGKYLELFARGKAREGWTVWGNEA